MGIKGLSIKFFYFSLPNHAAFASGIHKVLQNIVLGDVCINYTRQHSNMLRYVLPLPCIISSFSNSCFPVSTFYNKLKALMCCLRFYFVRKPKTKHIVCSQLRYLNPNLALSTFQVSSLTFLALKYMLNGCQIPLASPKKIQYCMSLNPHQFFIL